MSDFTDSNSTTEYAVPTEPWMAIFVDSYANGTPDKPSKMGFIALARLGKNVWNAWRNAFPCEMREMNGSIHLEGPKVDLSGCNFNHDSLSFKGFLFGDGADFEGSCFEKLAIFTDAKFGYRANFCCAQFKDLALFLGTQFGDSANFVGAQFHDQALFLGAQFEKSASFSVARFGYTDFRGAQLGDSTDFRCVTFTGNANFAGLDWGDLRNIYEELLDDRRTWANLRGLDPQEIKSIDFGGAWFGCSCNFSNRRFIGATNFGHSRRSFQLNYVSDDNGNMTIQTQRHPKVHFLPNLPTFFGYPPSFHNSNLHQGMTFRGAIFPQKALGTEECAMAYRTLRLAFTKWHAVRDEQLFFKLEMAEEAAIDKGHKAWLYSAYREVADYGFSLIRPLAWSLVLTIMFAIVYGLLMWGAGTTAGLAI